LAAKVSPQELWDFFENKIKEKFGDDGAELSEIVSDIGKIGKDIAKVSFDFENSYFQTGDGWSDRKFGPMQIGDLSFIGCMAGGDWEFPIYFVIYLDQDKKTLRGYIPGDGNPWNHDTKTAFGNDDVADSKFLTKWIKKNRPDLVDDDPDREYETDDADVMYDPKAIEKDIASRITVVAAQQKKTPAPVVKAAPGSKAKKPSSVKIESAGVGPKAIYVDTCIERLDKGDNVSLAVFSGSQEVCCLNLTKQQLEALKGIL
jgi:hypothetical protein